jgi:hypothetical protein
MGLPGRLKALLGGFVPRLRAREFAGLFRGRVAALRGGEAPPAGYGELLARWGVPPGGEEGLAETLSLRALLYLAAGAAFSAPLILGGSPSLGAIPMAPAVLGASLDAWRIDMLRRRRWTPFREYLRGAARALAGGARR